MLDRPFLFKQGNMDRKQQVLKQLKLKVKAFGFNRKELMSVAARIADNLTSKEEASEEEVNAEIATSIDAVLPYLQVSQSFANRVIEENRRKNDDDETDDGAGAGEPSDTGNRQTGSNKKNPKNKGNETDEEPAWFKAYREQQDARFAALEAEKTASSRRSRLEAVLKDSGTFGTVTLKSFDKMRFDSDEDFDEFLSEVEENKKAYNQERADAGLSTLGTPPNADGKKPKENEVISDADLQALAKTF